MYQKLLLLTLFFLVGSGVLFSQTADSIPTPTIQADTLSNRAIQNYQEETEDDFAPGLGLFALFAIIVMLLCIGAGVVLTVVGLLILFGLVGIGVLSTSAFIGLYTRSLDKAFKTFMVSTTSISGLLVGVAACWLVNKVMHWFTTPVTLAIGAIGGLLTGFLLGMALRYVIQRLMAFLKTKLKAN